MYMKTDLSNIRITGGFWHDKQKLLAGTTVSYIWDALNDHLPGVVKSGAIENFRIASGQSNAEFYGLVSQDSDLFKWMEAAAYSLYVLPSHEVEKKLDEMIELVGAVQQPDGYLNTYGIINGLENKWGYLKETCQLYCAGHLIEAAVAHFQVTGKHDLLDIACRYADCINKDFGPGEMQIHGYDGHAEVELALFRLFEATGEERYRKLAEYFVEERGKQPFFFEIERKNEQVCENLVYDLHETDFRHSQSHLPIREQKEAVGHAVKAMYFYTAAADMAEAENDQSLYTVLKKLWEDVTKRKMFITGAIGSSEYGESFTYAFDLQGGLMYGETCASIGLFIWAYHMLLIENDSRYADIMERVLYNGILCGISERGTDFFYTNALDVDPARCRNRKDYAHIEANRVRWFECPCCPSNIARLVLSLGKYLYSSSRETVNLHHFVTSTAVINGLKIIQQTGYPDSGTVNICTESEGAEAFVGCLRIRIPGWCHEYAVSFDGNAYDARTESGYFVFRCDWSLPHKITIGFDLSPCKVYISEKVNGMAGMTAVMRGPVVYCVEETDNGSLNNLAFACDGMVMVSESVFKDVYEIRADGFQLMTPVNQLYACSRPVREPVTLKLIPYRLWNNRGEGNMKVFLPEI